MTANTWARNQDFLGKKYTYYTLFLPGYTYKWKTQEINHLLTKLPWNGFQLQTRHLDATMPTSFLRHLHKTWHCKAMPSPMEREKGPSSVSIWQFLSVVENSTQLRNHIWLDLNKELHGKWNERNKPFPVFFLWVWASYSFLSFN